MPPSHLTCAAGKEGKNKVGCCGKNVGIQKYLLFGFEQITDSLH